MRSFKEAQVSIIVFPRVMWQDLAQDVLRNVCGTDDDDDNHNVLFTMCQAKAFAFGNPSILQNNPGRQRLTPFPFINGQG